MTTGYSTVTVHNGMPWTGRNDHGDIDRQVDRLTGEDTVYETHINSTNKKCLDQKEKEEEIKIRRGWNNIKREKEQIKKKVRQGTFLGVLEGNSNQTGTERVKRRKRDLEIKSERWLICGHNFQGNKRAGRQRGTKSYSVCLLKWPLGTVWNGPFLLGPFQP